MKNIIISISVIMIFSIVYLLVKPQMSQTEPFILPINTFKLSVPEPSGLFYEANSNTLWTVSDENSSIYNIDLKGNIIDSIRVNGFDLEGITIINDSTIVTIFERDREILFLNKKGIELRRIKLDLDGEPNKGIEGISFNSKNSHLYLVNEKEPRLLIEINMDGEIVSKTDLRFAHDFSGLQYDEIEDMLWIISDEDSSIFKCNMDGSIISHFKLNVEQIEGIAIDRSNSLLFIISDPLEKLYIFKLP